MAGYIIDKNAKSLVAIKDFDYDDYHYSEKYFENKKD